MGFLVVDMVFKVVLKVFLHRVLQLLADLLSVHELVQVGLELLLISRAPFQVHVDDSQRIYDVREHQATHQHENDSKYNFVSVHGSNISIT